MSISLAASADAPIPVGTPVIWRADVADADAGTLWYRFRIRRLGSEYRVVRDYGPVSTLDWSSPESEGYFEVELSVRNTETGDVRDTSVVYQTLSRVSGDSPVLSETANPLVSLYSAPACPEGSRMRVEFQSPEGFVRTPYRPCGEGSMNFHLAGMRSETQYWVRHIIDNGSETRRGPFLTLTTPTVSLPFTAHTVVLPPQPPVGRGVLLHGTLFERVIATDLYGNLLWYYPERLSSLTRPEAGGTFFGIIQDFTADESRQIVREFDVAGTTLRETNAARINEQLIEQGKRTITGFHHEAGRLPDGKIVVLASTEQIMTGVQGPEPVDVIGDMILVLDPDMQVVWTWDAFDHLDPYRLATANEVCTQAGAGCPPFHLAERANDWLHGNAVTYTPDGHLLLSLRHQDWLVKIDYADGQGSGNVLWRLGQDGDFQIISNAPQPWFSHQHDGRLFSDGTLVVYDNGNLRRMHDGNANSRGQVYQIDEQNRTATLIVNADLGAYSAALGSAQKLPNGRYHFESGFNPGSTARAIEVDGSGNVVYGLETATPVYRSFRMRDLFTP